MRKPKLWDNEKHEEALRRRREKDYCRHKEKDMQDIPDDETTETPVEQNPVTTDDEKAKKLIETAMSDNPDLSELLKQSCGGEQNDK